MDIAIRLQSPGGIEQLETIEWSVQAPGPGEIRLRHTAIGVNFLDIYHRTGFIRCPHQRSWGLKAPAWLKLWAKVSQVSLSARRWPMPGK
jgi:NADPH2:quinone reductase